MGRTTIVVPEELLEQLRRVANERRTSLATLIREALEEKARSHRPKPRSLGMADSGSTDTSRRASDDEYVPPSASRSSPRSTTTTSG